MRPKLQAPPEAGWCHVMNRAAPGEAWLEHRRQASDFVRALGEIVAALPCDVHAYCALPRHFHVLMRAEAGVAREAVTALERAAAFPADRIARIVRVTFGRHLMEVSRYLHLNPVTAGLSWRPEDWPYSSLRGYLGDPSAPRWLVTHAVLGRFGALGARHRYRAYVYAGLDPGARDGLGRPRWAALFRGNELLEDLAWRIEPVVTPQPGSKARRRPTELRPLLELAEHVAARFDVSVDALRMPRRGGVRAALARGALVHAARAANGYTLIDTAAWLGYASPAAAAAAAERFDRALAASR